MHCLCKFFISNLFLSSATVQNIFFDAIDLHNWLKLLLYKYCKNEVSTWKRSQGLWRICTSSSELWRTDNLVTQIRNLIRIAILVYWYNSETVCLPCLKLYLKYVLPTFPWFINFQNVTWFDCYFFNQYFFYYKSTRLTILQRIYLKDNKIILFMYK